MKKSIISLCALVIVLIPASLGLIDVKPVPDPGREIHDLPNQH